VQACRVWTSGRHCLASARCVVLCCHVPSSQHKSRGSITTRMDPLFFGCRWMIIPVQTFSSEWYMWSVDAFLILSLIFPTSRWTFFSEPDPTKYVRNAFLHLTLGFV
jgi:hypothetical protein